VDLAAGEGAVWVIDDDERNLRRIDPESHEVDGEPLPLPGKPRALAVGEGAVWVAVEEPDSLVRVDPQSAQVAATVRVPFSPSAVAAGDGAVWTGGAGRLARVDPTRNRLHGDPAAIDGDAGSIALDEEAVWVAVPEEKVLARVDPRSGRATRRFPVGTGAEEVAVGREGTVWIAGGEDGGTATLAPGANAIEGFEGETGLVDVAADSEGDVWTLSGTFGRKQTGSTRTIYVRGVGRHDGGKDRTLGTGEVVPSEVTHLAVGEGSAWLIQPEYGPDDTGAIRWIDLKPRDELEPQS
jgi:streptogramin lyase